MSTWVRYMQSSSAPAAGSAAANAPTQAYSVKTAAQMRATASPQAKMVRSFNVGDLVYPTGQKNGVWWGSRRRDRQSRLDLLGHDQPALGQIAVIPEAVQRLSGIARPTALAAIPALRPG